MRILVLLLCLFSGLNSWGQITKNPKVTKKSTDDTFINRITITEEYTIVSMQHKVKSAEEQMKKYFEANPKEKEELSRMNPLMRNLMLQQWMQQMETSSATISIQPETHLLASDGRKFKFIKATNIPVSPETQNVQPGKDYFFRVYFEKLDPGITEVDIIESDIAYDGTMTYWNFYGVKVNNPAEGTPAVEEDVALVEPEQATGEVLVKGKVLDFDTNKPIQAKIVAKVEGEEVYMDSVVTSRTGYFEFLLPSQVATFDITASNYLGSTQSVDLTKSKSELTYDIYLEAPLEVTSEEPIEEVKEEQQEYEEMVLDEVDDEEAAEETLERVDENTIRLNNVLFVLGKDEIILSSYRELDKLVDFMKENPDLKINIVGHTDNQGDEELNKDLSLRRAQAVKKYLAKNGIESSTMTCEGKGSTQPAFPNDTEANRQKNRRVEIEILE